MIAPLFIWRGQNFLSPRARGYLILLIVVSAINFRFWEKEYQETGVPEPH
jgi:hypothetical protein